MFYELRYMFHELGYMFYEFGYVFYELEYMFYELEYIFYELGYVVNRLFLGKGWFIDVTVLILAMLFWCGLVMIGQYFGQEEELFSLLSLYLLGWEFCFWWF